MEESSRTNESVGKLFNEAARDPTIIFHHDSGCLAQPGVHCNCTFATMNFNEISALDTAAQSGCDGLNTKSILQIRLSARDNQILSNIASFFGVFTGARQGKQASPKPTSALRIMTAGDEEGRVFLGPNGIFYKSFASTRAAVTELRALVARQAAAILRLLGHLAHLGGGAAAPRAIAAGAPGSAPGGAPGGALGGTPTALPHPPPAAAAAEPPRSDGGARGEAQRPPPPAAAAGPAPPAQAPYGDLTVDQLRPLLSKALKIPKPRSKATIGSDLARSSIFQRRRNCAQMTNIWMENCGPATNETVPARIFAASVDPKVLKASVLLLAGTRVRSAASVRREQLRFMRGIISEKRLDPLFSQKQAVERAKSGISSRNLADMRRMNRNALGASLDKFDKWPFESRHE